jgi:citrate lyase subunit beta/citryl-CoA lyase
LTIPKVRSGECLRLVDETLTELEREREIPAGSVRLIAQIETAEGLMHLDEIARSTPRLAAMSVGPEDLAADLGSAVHPDVLYHPNMQALIAARAAGIIPLGYVGSITLYDDPDTYRSWIRRARGMGFEGAFCIHPNQVEILNEEFVPDTEEVERASAMVAAFEEHIAAGTGAFAFEGRMVDAPVINRARRLLKRSNRLA